MSWEKVQISHTLRTTQLQNFHFKWHMALPHPSDTLGMQWALRRPRKVCKPKKWQRKAGRPQSDSGRQEGHRASVHGPGRENGYSGIQTYQFLFRVPPKATFNVVLKRLHHRQEGCAQRPAGPTQTSSFASAELLERQDSQCFCTSGS